jgi:glycosyltransferase involved in cell wall biosynthesis
MMISFIIPAHNEERLLPRTIESIHKSAKELGEAYEIIVADDASTDATGAVAEQLGARVVRVDHRQISKTRNSGAAEAKGEVFVFVDADTTIGPALLRGVRENLRAGAVGGGAAVAFDGRMPLHGRITVPVFMFFYRLSGLAAGCFVYCTRGAFNAVGGFDEELFASEEVAFSRAMRQQGGFVLLREAAVTSGRKLRTYGFWEILRMLFSFALGGMRSMKSRDKLGLWYDPRRNDVEE